jgi:hypothetical protein
MRRSLLTSVALFAVPAVASDFTNWTRPTLPADCVMHFARLYQDGDGKPIHIVVHNGGTVPLKLSLIALVNDGKTNVRDEADINAKPNQIVDTILVKDVHGATSKSEIKVSLKGCVATK